MNKVLPILKDLFKFLSSLKLAVLSILGLATILGVATVVESFYGMRAVHVMIYRTGWFGGTLFLLGTNVLCAALSRYPWKRRQTGFVVTHSGILILLFGSLLTQQFGVDGNLPVSEKSEDSRVILDDLKLTLTDETGVPLRVVSIPESGKSAFGEILRLETGKENALIVNGFMPRTLPDKKVSPAPLGLGFPSVRVELYNERFRLEEWLANRHPDRPTDIDLGPATLSLQTLWTEAQEQQFLSTDKKVERPDKGTLFISYAGREYRFKIDRVQNRWMSLGQTPFQFKIESYLPYAVVENNELVTRSNEPINPAIQVRVKNRKGQQERHSVFALFPEFSTLHQAHQGSNGFGLHLKMSAEAKNISNLSIVGNRRGKLQFAQSADGKKLFYKAMGAAGDIRQKGTAILGKEIPTGWMDLRFKVTEWLPAAMEEVAPRNLELVSGQEGNTLAAIRVVTQPRLPASEKTTPETEPGKWLMEGDSMPWELGSNRYFVRFSKERLALPFAIHLDKFTVGNDPGTNKAATYQSEVTVQDRLKKHEEKATISMNEPLKYGGYTFYQASYQMEEGRPPISIFAVNYDPGRWVKYLGALLIVLGSALMFYMNPHYWDKVFRWGKT